MGILSKITLNRIPLQTGSRRDDSEKAITAAATTATTTTPTKTTRRYLARGIRKNLPAPGRFGKREAGNGTPLATPIAELARPHSVLTSLPTMLS